MKNVLIIGSINMDYTVYVDHFPRNGETLIGKSRYVQPGGKGANQATAVAKSSKVNCIFKGAIGDDSDGKAILSALNDYGVKTDLKISKNGTGNATIVVDETSENKIIIIGGANTDLLPNDIDESLIKKADYVILQNEIPSETNEFVIKKAHELGKIVVYNPAPYRPFSEDLFKCIDYFVPNETELEQCTGEGDLDKACQKVMSLGCKNLIVTLGSKGSLLVGKDKYVKINSYKVEAVDTVAAGDTFVGYFVSGIASGMSEETALKFASKASSITVCRKGSLVSIPFGKEVII